MSDALKLKDHLATNVAKALILHKRGKAYDDKFKPGKKQYMYIFRDGSTEYVHYANDREEEVLRLFQPGDTVTAIRQEATSQEGQRYYFVTWTEPGDIQASAVPQLRSNTAETRQDRAQENYQEEKMVHDWKLGIAGIVQALLIRGESEEDIKKKSLEWAQWIRTEARRQASIDIASRP